MTRGQCGIGGTTKNGVVELQGDRRVKKAGG
jgi:translation initiation factor 1 (eIF-1/SUI1)